MWVFNVFLYLCFLFNPPIYQGLREAGATCYVYVPDHGEAPATDAPECWYE